MNDVNKKPARMELTGEEAGNYLLRFYEALARKAGTKIGDNGFVLGQEDSGKQIFIVKMNSVTDSVEVVNTMPALELTRHFYHTGQSSFGLHRFGRDGITEITIKLPGAQEVTEIPFAFSFNFDQDIQAFINRLSSIESVSYDYGTEPVLNVRTKYAIFSSYLQK